MKNKIKRVLFLVLFISSIAATSVNGMFHKGDDDLRMFIDYWGWIQEENGEWTIGRITHCNDPGTNCIIGPTVIGPC